jgi:hypothetical protein
MTTFSLFAMLVALVSFGGLVVLALAFRRFARDSARRFDRFEARFVKLESTVSAHASSTGGALSRKSLASARRAERSVTPSRKLISVPDLAAPLTATLPLDDLGRRYGAIWDLAEAGASPESIARDTGQPVGEVELILGLKRPRAASASALPSGGARLS